MVNYCLYKNIIKLVSSVSLLAIVEVIWKYERREREPERKAQRDRVGGTETERQRETEGEKANSEIGTSSDPPRLWEIEVCYINHSCFGTLVTVSCTEAQTKQDYRCYELSLWCEIEFYLLNVGKPLTWLPLDFFKKKRFLFKYIEIYLHLHRTSFVKIYLQNSLRFCFDLFLKESHYVG